MASPTTRQEFKQYCLRKLGAPVLKIEVADEQIEDRIDEAVKYYNDYHYDGSVNIYYKHLVTDADKANKYITVPESVIGITRIFQIGDPSMSTGDIFNVNYQLALNDLYSLTSINMVPYYLAMEHLALVQELLVGKQPIRYNRHQDRVYVDMNWDKAATGTYILFEAYETLDADEFSDIWSDRWLQNYATVLIQEQWGLHLTKFNSLQLVGGVQFNAAGILSSAKEERAKLETEMIYSFSLPVFDLMG